MNIAHKIGDELKSFGGHLECTVCGSKRPLGNVGTKMANGWPKCCGYTMRWFTAKELEERNGIDPTEPHSHEVTEAV